jgi:hypothetical protein
MSLLELLREVLLDSFDERIQIAQIGSTASCSIALIDQDFVSNCILVA